MSFNQSYQTNYASLDPLYNFVTCSSLNRFRCLPSQNLSNETITLFYCNVTKNKIK